MIPPTERRHRTMMKLGDAASMEAMGDAEFIAWATTQFIDLIADWNKRAQALAELRYVEDVIKRRSDVARLVEQVYELRREVRNLR